MSKRIAVFSLCWIGLLVVATPSAAQPVLYVNASGPGGMGTSWDDALADLQGALQIAESTPGVMEIWVAAGIYVPSGQGNREESFMIRDGVSLYGGFAGHELLLDDRRPLTNPTILSGDLDGDDLGEIVGSNSLHVLQAFNLALPTTVDGFIVQGGNADGDGVAGHGGGTHILGATVTISNCQFLGNRCQWGGGAIYLEGSEVLLENTIIAGNEHFGGGGEAGGIYVAPESSLEVLQCTIWGNTSGEGAGGIQIHPYNSQPASVNNCIVRNNDPAQILGPAEVSFSNVEGGVGGSGNVDESSLFMDPGSLDFRHQPGSPDIDGGDSPAVPSTLLRDLAGGARIVGASVDRGALEFTTKLFVRGDVDSDGLFNGVVDGLFLLNAFFVPGSVQPLCLEASDVNNDGLLNALVDGIHLLNYQFVPGSSPIAPPFPGCGPDDDNVLGCEMPACP